MFFVWKFISGELSMSDFLEYSEVKKIILSENSVSRFEDYGSFQILILRRILFDKVAMTFVPEIFIFEPEVVHHYDKESGELNCVKESYSGLFELLESFYSNNQKLILGYSEGIESLEESLFERKISKIFMDNWFDFKKDIAKIENYYSRNIFVFQEFLKKMEIHKSGFLETFSSIENMILLHISNIQILKGRLDSIHHYYGSIKNDRLSKTIFMLTVISGIFLPLNLIVGFFGMNTDGMIFKDNPMGTRNVIILLGTVVLSVLLGVKVISTLDRYFFRFVLGRYDFYNNIVKKLNEFDARIKGK